MSYRVRLSAFEGPLDLLLHLIGRAKIEIKDIFISEITEQYLSYMDETGQLDPDTASEFLQMAATLLYIKSRSILPRRRDDDLDESGLTPEEQLIERLNEYKRYKEASEQLREMEAEAIKLVYKQPDELPESERYGDGDLAALFDAYCRVVERARNNARPDTHVVITQDGFSIKTQSAMILARLSIMEKMSFEQLMEEDPSRLEVAVTFIALVWLLHNGRVTVRQSGTLGRIFISKKDGDFSQEELDVIDE